ncbi:MAG: hypothetical protein JWL76_1473 [Thermoleophilia bacterium]|nr:hypothetical protein [Thermoleophilia bacterium]
MGVGESDEGVVGGSELGRSERREKVKSKVKGGLARAGVTERDLEIARWLGRHRLATAEQVIRRFEIQRSKAYQRLAVLVDHGLVRHDEGVRSARIYLATPQGLTATGLDLPRARVSPATAAHDLAVVDAAIGLEQSTMQLLLTEREIRRIDQRGDARFRIAAVGAPDTADARGMWPDLVTYDRINERLHAFEVELSLKKYERLVDKLGAYARSTYATVTYICGADAIARSIAKAGARAGMADRLTIETLAQAMSNSRPVGELDRLLEVVRQERERAKDLEQRLADALEQAQRERCAGFGLIEEIARYLAADRAEQRATRERWRHMTERAAQLHIV